jgi:hypothetical protein
MHGSANLSVENSFHVLINAKEYVETVKGMIRTKSAKNYVKNNFLAVILLFQNALKMPKT